MTEDRDEQRKVAARGMGGISVLSKNCWAGKPERGEST